MKNSLRYLLIALMALGLLACKKEEAVTVVEEEVKVLVAPARDDGAGWKTYLQEVVKQNMGNINNSLFLYYLPPESDEDFEEKYDAQKDNAANVLGRGITAGNLIAFGSPVSEKMANIAVDAFKDVPADTMKGVRVIFIGDAVDNERVQAAVTPSGSEYVFVEAK